MQRAAGSPVRVEGPSGGCAVVDLQHGGAILSFQLDDGWELFAQGSPPRQELALGDPFIHSGLTGHVDCLPTISACRVPGVPPDPLVDHGALWTATWTAAETDSDRMQAWLRATVDVPGWPVTVARTVVVSQSGLRLDYELVNESDMALPVLWAGHGLLAAPAGSRVRALEWSPTRVDAISAGWTSEAATADVAEVASHAGMDVDALPRGEWVKAFGRWPEGGVWLLRDRAVHVQADGPGDALWLGLWLNNGGHPRTGPLRHVALEPTTGNADNLADCVRCGTCWWAPPSSRTRWSMTYTIHQSEAAMNDAAPGSAR